MSSAELTRRRLTLSTRDIVTGWCSKVFAESTITGSIQNAGNNPLSLAVGAYAKYPHTGYTPDVIRIGDECIDADNKYFLVRSAEQLWRFNEFIGYICNMQKIDAHSDRATSSGIWHLDSESSKTDSRYRHKLYFETYLEPLYLDDGATEANIQFMFAGVDYPLLYEFLPGWEDNDLVVTIDKSVLTPLFDYRHVAYAFEETVLITLWAINKAGLTATNLIDQMEEAIKHVVTDYPIGSIRKISKIDNKPVDLDGFTLYSSTVTLNYTRANDEYTPSDTLTYGSGITAGTFTFPNIINYKNPFANRDSFTDMPGRLGDYPFLLGAKSDTIDVICDLDFGDWLRIQGGAKTDSLPWQVFKDIVGNGVTEPSQVLSVAGEVHAVRLNANLELSPNSHTITLHFTEYNPTPASSNYKTRHGIT